MIVPLATLPLSLATHRALLRDLLTSIRDRADNAVAVRAMTTHALEDLDAEVASDHRARNEERKP